MNNIPPTLKRLNARAVDAKSLAIHSAIADKLIAFPDKIKLAQTCLENRYAHGLMRYGTYIVWQSLLPLLQTDPELFKQELLASEQKMEQLRRRTIFVGILTEQEREEALNKVV